MNPSQKWFNYLHTERNLSVQAIQEAQLKIDRDRLDIPIFDADGNKLFSKYRKAPWDTSETPKYTYEVGSKVSLYGVHNKSQHERLFICEGEIDVMSIRTAGYDAVSSTGGAMTWCEEWKLDRVPTLLFDNDEAGLNGAMKTLFILGEAIYSWIPPAFGKDANDVLANKGVEFLQNILNDPSRQIHINLNNLSTKKSIKDKKRELQSLAKGMEMSVGKDFMLRLVRKLIELENVYKPKKANMQHDGTQLAKAKSYPIENLLKVERQGIARNKAICPFHGERTPSLHIYPNNTAYCFGACGKRFDVIDIYQQLHGCDTRTAIVELSEKV